MKLISLAPAAAVAAALALSACAPVLPPIAAGVAGDAAFKSSMAMRFPPGSSSEALRAELEREGFKVYGDASWTRHQARFAFTNLPCETLVRVDWLSDRRGRIVRLGAERHDCS